MRIFNFPPGSFLGLVVALALFVGAGAALWKIRAHKSSDRFKRGMITAGLVTAGTAMIVSSVNVLTVWANYAYGLGEDPTVSDGAYMVAGVMLVVLMAAVGVTVVYGQRLLIFAAVVIWMAAFTHYAYTEMFYHGGSGWALTYGIGWIVTGVAALALVAVAAWAWIRAYGSRQFEAGKLDGIDTLARANAHLTQGASNPR